MLDPRKTSDPSVLSNLKLRNTKMSLLEFSSGEVFSGPTFCRGRRTMTMEARLSAQQ